MSDVNINYAAVFAAAVVNIALGFIWYNEKVFGKKWMSLIGKRPQDLKKNASTQMYLMVFVGAIVMAYVLAHFVGYVQANTMIEGAQTGFWAWLGFVATTSLANHIFAGRARDLYFLDNGYHLLTLIVTGALLAVWG